VSQALGLILIALLVLLVVFLVFREFFCWYWKVNEALALLRDLRGALSNPGAAASAGALPQASHTGEPTDARNLGPA
jgi:hypothetical protein